MKIPLLMGAVAASLALAATARAEPVLLDAVALSGMRAGVAPSSDTLIEDIIIQNVGFGGLETPASGPPARIALRLEGGPSAVPLILSDVLNCAATSCNQVSTHIAVGLVIQNLPAQNLPATARGF
jgi:hypothetical protein